MYDNACFSSDGTSDDRECGSRSEEIKKNYDIVIKGKLGRYEEGNVGDTEPATDAHNSVADETEITADQLREMINEL
jgi:hypothetical protein